jgi:sugar/nucleoside kinase (ribokinase family)
MLKHYKISGTGCALVDYLYKPIDFSGDVFKKYISRAAGDGGLSPGKLVFTEEFEKYSQNPYPALRKEITSGKAPVGTNIGGPSMVSLVHASQMLYDLPATVEFSGCMGSDEAGTFIREKLSQTPLKIRNYKTSPLFTPFTDVLSDPDYDAGHGERIFINNIGAAWDFMPADLNDSFFDSQMVVFGGTALVPNIHKSLSGLLKKAKKHKAITLVNTVYDFLSEKENPGKHWPLGESDDAYSHIDLLIADKEEALRHSGTQNINDALEYFKRKGTGAAIITHGPQPVSFFANNEIFGKIDSSQMLVSKRVREEMKTYEDGDTTGCGDNFTGGVIASVARQQIITSSEKVDLRQAIAMGIASGGFACFYHGGTFFENRPGEKAGKVKTYFEDYLLQEKIF